MTNFYDAKNKIQMGSESNIRLSEEEKKITAYHEIGHALIAKLVDGPKVSQVSILPRGQSLGQTFFDVEERYSHTKEDIEKQIKICLGGRVAEKFITKTESTGASDDLKKATNLARSLVCSFGMSHFGSISVEYGSVEYQMLSEETKKALDKETFSLLNKMLKEVESQLHENLLVIETMVDKLLAVETLTAKEFYDL
jgi:cell division protease FtsH